MATPPADSSSSQSADAWLTPVRFGLILAALMFATWPDVVLGSRTFCFRDFGFFGYPLASYHREVFWRGELPFWNPYNYTGIPFLAQWNTLTLYPGSLIYLLFPLQWSLGWFCLLHQFLAGMGMFYLARRWTGSPLGAGLAGIAYAFNGVMFNCLMWPNNIAALGLLPWLVMAMERAWHNGGRAMIPAALIGGLQLLTGAPEIIGLTWVMLVLLALRAMFAEKQSGGQLDSKPIISWPFGIRIGLRFLILLLITVGLAAAQLLPFIELLRHSQRDINFSDGAWAMPGTGWANFLAPRFHSYRFLQGVPMQLGQYWVSSYYLGAGVTALALLAMILVKAPYIRTLGILTLASLLLALGDNAFLYPLIKKLLPLIGWVRFPIKFIVLAVFSVPLLAAFAVKYCVVSSQPRRLWREFGFLWGSVLALTAAIIAFDHYFPLDVKYAALQGEMAASAGIATVAATLLLGLLLLLAHGLSTRAARFAQAGLLLIVGVEAAWQFPRAQVNAPSEVFSPNYIKLNPPPTLSHGRAMISPEANLSFHRTGLPDATRDFLLKRRALFANANLLDHLPKVDGFYSLVPREIEAVNQLVSQTSAPAPNPLLDFLGVNQVTRTNDFFEWNPRPTALPLVTAGQAIEFTDDQDSVRQLTNPAFRPHRQVMLTPQAASSIPQTNAAIARVENAAVNDQSIAFTVETDQPTVAVIAQTYYSAWQASVDGKPAPILRANYAFQAVAVPAGRHQVILSYRDIPFEAGTAISLLTLAGCLLYQWRARNDLLA